jgi:hypothetical protein
MYTGDPMNRYQRVRRLTPLIGVAALTVSLTVAATGASEAGKPTAALRPHAAARALPPGNAVVRWNAYVAAATQAACIAPADNPINESQIYAATQLAIHDAINAIDRRNRPYAFHGSQPGANLRAAAAAAGKNTLVAFINRIGAPVPQSCRDAGVDTAEAAYTHELGLIPDSNAKTLGIQVGERAAAAIIASRANDGSDTPLVVDTYPQGDEPGEYRFTPGTPFAFAPGWGHVTPWGLQSAGQFHVPPPFDLRSGAYLHDFRQVKRLGGDDVTTPSARSAEQTQIALFWLENSPSEWNRITRGLALQRHLGLWASARLFGLLDMAMADGYVSTFYVKYDVYNFWRPVTAIQLAATDGNPRTHADPTWTPLVTTPPIPDHDSGHSVEGGAAEAVLRGFFGTDSMAFSTCSYTLPVDCNATNPTTRSFTSFSQAARENAWARVLIGFHFRHATTTGRVHGMKIGRWMVGHYLQPVH